MHYVLGVLSELMSVHHMCPNAFVGHKRISVLLGLEFHAVVSSYGGAGN